MTDEFKIYMSEPAIRKEIPYGVEWNVGMVEDRITGNLYPIHYAHDAKRFFGAGAGCRKSMRYRKYSMMGVRAQQFSLQRKI